MRWREHERSAVLRGIAVLGCVATLGAAEACGSRTALPFLDGEFSSGGGPGGGEDGSIGDASIDGRGGRDGATEQDGTIRPGDDGSANIDAGRAGCVPTEPIVAYFLTLYGDFGTFDPPTATFGPTRRITCSHELGANPHTMAVDRSGQIFILYDDDFIYHLNPSTLACDKTVFLPRQQEFPNRFGMAFRYLGDAGDELRIFSSPTPSRLAAFDPKTFVFRNEVAVTPDIMNLSDLAALPNGQLFAFDKAILSQINIATGALIDPVTLPDLPQGPWSVLAWRGDFFLFDAEAATNGPSFVRRYRPSDKSTVVVAQYENAIIAAAASTCAE